MESKFIEIDFENWERKDIFKEYGDVAYFVTIDVDVTRYIDEFRKRIKFYPFMTYVVSRVANEHSEYRYAKKDGKIGYYEHVDPIYTLLRSNHLFTHKVTDYSEDFVDFYHRFVEDKKIGEACNKLYADGYRPHNSISVSTMPHMSFTQMGFLYDSKDGDAYIPFATFGKYFERNGRWYCPVSTEFFHGINDGFHAERFYMFMQKVIDTVEIDLDRI